MTEADWFVCDDPRSMLRSLFTRWSSRGKGPSERINRERLRLFACASCRRLWGFLDEDHRKCLTMIEEHAYGPVAGGLRQALRVRSRAEEKRLSAEFRLQCNERPNDHVTRLHAIARMWATGAVHMSAARKPFVATIAHEYIANAFVSERLAEAIEDGTGQSANIAANFEVVAKPELTAQAALLRDIVGNSYRSITANPDWSNWQNATIPKIAAAIYTEHAFGDLPILADALEEAGCDDADILAHCRSGGEHVRGCWVVDLVLGKS